MDQKMVEILTALQRAAETIGVQAVRLWPQIVAVTFVQSLALLILDLGTMVFLAVLARRLWRHHRNLIASENDDSVVLIPAASAVVCGGLALFCLWMATTQLPGVLYPEAVTVLRLAGK